MSRNIKDNDNPDKYVNNTKAFISHQSTATRTEWDDIVSNKCYIKAADNAYQLTHWPQGDVVVMLKIISHHRIHIMFINTLCKLLFMPQNTFDDTYVSHN